MISGGIVVNWFTWIRLEDDSLVEFAWNEKIKFHFKTPYGWMFINGTQKSLQWGYGASHVTIVYI